MKRLPANFTIQKYGVVLRFVYESDASFILSLRNDDALGRFISATSTNVNDQVEWICKYKEREKQGEEYYFIIADTEQNALGTIRLYNFNGNTFDSGSWLFSPSSPWEAAIKGDLIAREIAYDMLGFEIGTFEVRKANKKVLKYHSGFKPTTLKEDDLNIYFSLSKENFSRYKERLLKLIL